MSPDESADEESIEPTNDSTESVEPEDDQSSALDGERADDPIDVWTATDDGDLASLSDLTVALTERDGYLDSLRRLQADFDNFRKRTARQQSDLLGHASEALIERLLPVLDALDLALVHADERNDEADAAVSESGQALAQIASLLRGVLAKEGLERIDAAQVPFDPTLHDAVLHLEAEPDDRGSGGDEVAEIMRAGYSLKGRVLRPAMVSVRS